MASKKVSTEESLEEKYLPKKKVILLPTPRHGAMIEDTTHVMFFMVEGATKSWTLPRRKEAPGPLVNPFESQEEQKFFEDKLGIDLNINKKVDNYWHTFKVVIKKDGSLMHLGKVFDLSDPLDNLKVKVLKHQIDVAPTWEEKKKMPEYVWALKDENEDIYEKANNAEETTKAYIHFSKLQQSELQMIKFLKIYGSANKLNNNIPKDAKKNFLIGEIQSIIQNDLNKYLSIIDDDNWDIKVFIEDAMDIGAIIKQGKKYSLEAGDPINPLDSTYVGTISELAKWAADQDDRYLLIKTRIENSN